MSTGLALRTRRLVHMDDGSLPLPPHALEDLEPGTLVRVHRADDGWCLEPLREEDP